MVKLLGFRCFTFYKFSPLIDFMEHRWLLFFMVPSFFALKGNLNNFYSHSAVFSIQFSVTVTR